MIRQFWQKHGKKVQVLLGFLLLGLVIWCAEPQKLLTSLKAAPLGIIAPWILIYYLLITVSSGLGLHALFRRIDSRQAGKIIAASFKLQVLATIVPGRLGDLGLVYFLKDAYSPAQTSAILIVDKMITLLLNILLAIIGVGVLFSWQQALLLLVCLGIGMAVLFWFLLHCPSQGLRRTFVNKLISKLEGFRCELRATCQDFQGLWVNMVLTAIRALLAGVSMLILLACFQISFPLWDIILIQALTQLTTLVPITTMGLGIQEAVNVYLFSLYRIPADIILAISIWGRAIYLILTAFIYGGWVMIGKQDILKADSGRQAKETESTGLN